MGKEPYCKVPLSVFNAAMSLPRTSQQDKLLAAYVRVFFTDDPGEVPANIRPVFEVVRGTADSIKKARIDGANGWAARVEKAANDGRTVIGEYPNDGRAVIGQNGNGTTTSGNSNQPYIPPYAPISNAIASSNASTTGNEPPGVGVAVEPPTRGELERAARDVNDPDPWRLFVEYGEGAGWDVPGYRDGLVIAYNAWKNGGK